MNIFITFAVNMINYFKRYYFPVVIKRKTPVIVFNPGRVGSSEMYRSLKSRGVAVFLMHDLCRYSHSYGFLNSFIFSPTRIYFSSVMYGHLKKGKHVKVIHFKRDRVKRNISCFFAIYSRYFNYFKNLSDEDILQLFIERYHHGEIDNWYDIEFEHMKKFNVDIHVFKNNDENRLKEIGKLTGISDLKLVKSPVGVKNKYYGDRYKEFITGEVFKKYRDENKTVKSNMKIKK